MDAVLVAGTALQPAKPYIIAYLWKQLSLITISVTSYTQDSPKELGSQS